MKFVLRHRVTGMYLAGLESNDNFGFSPNESDAVRFDSFDAAERERRSMYEYGAVWMAVPLQER